MKKGIIAKKLGMTQRFTETGQRIAVTVLEVGPCPVVQVKTKAKDGYNAIQLGFQNAKIKRLTKPFKGQFDKASVPYKKTLKEFPLDDISSYTVGQELKADVFEVGERIDITGISKGKGFQGNIKRHGFSRGPMSHGSKYHRGVGALSAATDPGKVPKGRKLPGQMGNKRITAQNILVFEVDAEKNYILVKGAVPGPRGTIVTLKNTVKN